MILMCVPVAVPPLSRCVPSGELIHHRHPQPRPDLGFCITSLGSGCMMENETDVLFPHMKLTVPGGQKSHK